MGHIVQTKAGSYRANWRDAAGRQRAKTFRTKREAAAYLADVETSLNRGSYVDPHAGRRALRRLRASAGSLRGTTRSPRRRGTPRSCAITSCRDGAARRSAKIDHLAVQQWVTELGAQLSPATVTECFRLTSAGHADGHAGQTHRTQPVRRCPAHQAAAHGHRRPGYRPARAGHAAAARGAVAVPGAGRVGRRDGPAVGRVRRPALGCPRPGRGHRARCPGRGRGVRSRDGQAVSEVASWPAGRAAAGVRRRAARRARRLYADGSASCSRRGPARHSGAGRSALASGGRRWSGQACSARSSRSARTDIWPVGWTETGTS